VVNLQRLNPSKTYSLKDIKHRLKHINKIVNCGIHSGIPICCIRFYVSDWLWIVHDPRSSTWRSYWNQLEKKRKPIYNPKTKKVKYNFEYIPCPDCLKKNSFSKIKKCPKGSTCHKPGYQ
jgi:hypothetical protein